METFTLDNGMRIVCAPSSSKVVYCGIAVDAGTRDELPHESGMAHFVEHMSFKGTERRRSWHIINRMDSVGGDLNAYTGKEETVFYCTALKQHLGRAIDLLFDITLHSIYPQHEMDKEVEVVIDEIESYNDSPSDLIYDEFEGMLFPGHPLGRNILGEAKKLRKHKSEDMQVFARRLYQPSRMTLFVYGNVTMKRVLSHLPSTIYNVQSEGGGHVSEHVPSAIRNVPSDLGRVEPAELILPSEPVVRNKRTHQAHVMMGARAFGGNDERHRYLHLLSNILGGPSMNSRLNLALRERNGLVYTVESGLTTYTDTGVWSVYFGCDPHDVDRCRQLVLDELKRLTDAPLTPRELAAAKRQIKGQLGVSWDNGESVAIGMGKRMLHYNTTQTLQQTLDLIDAITAEDLLVTARTVFQPERLTTLIYK